MHNIIPAMLSFWAGNKHCLSNPERETLMMTETQADGYLGEDDIVR